MRLLKSLCVSVALLAGALVPQTASAAGSPSVYWGAYVNGAPYYTAPLDQFESDAGKRESIVFWGEPWAINGSMQPFQAQEFETVRQRGSIPLIGWTSQDLSDGITQPNYTLAKIYGGTYDAYITTWAQDAKAWGHPFFMRFDHELNGWWYPWNEQINGNHPGDYVKAWRHVVDIFRSVGATNATWVWNVNTTSNVATALPDLYPGDNYVDWTGMDGYNWGTDHGYSWFWFDQVFGLNPWSKHNTYEDILAVAPTKPIMVGETATSKNGGDPAAWMKDTLLTQLPQKYTQVKALIWMNWNADDASLSWPIESSAAQQTGFRQSIAWSYYASNTFSSLPFGPIYPLAGDSSGSSGGGPAGSHTVSVPETGDTYVDASLPTSTAGGPSHYVISDGSPIRTAYVRFDLSSLAGKTIDAATLRIHTSADPGAGSNATFDILFVSNDTWAGSTMNYDNAVSISSTLLGTLVSPSDAQTWYAASLSTAVVQANVGRVLAMAVKAPLNADGVIFNSREAGSDVTPQLIVTYD